MKRIMNRIGVARIGLVAALLGIALTVSGLLSS